MGRGSSGKEKLFRLTGDKRIFKNLWEKCVISLKVHLGSTQIAIAFSQKSLIYIAFEEGSWKLKSILSKSQAEIHFALTEDSSTSPEGLTLQPSQRV